MKMLPARKTYFKIYEFWIFYLKVQGLFQDVLLKMRLRPGHFHDKMKSQDISMISRTSGHPGSNRTVSTCRDPPVLFQVKSLETAPHKIFIDWLISYWRSPINHLACHLLVRQLWEMWQISSGLTSVQFLPWPFALTSLFGKVCG